MYFIAKVYFNLDFHFLLKMTIFIIGKMRKRIKQITDLYAM